MIQKRKKQAVKKRCSNQKEFAQYPIEAYINTCHLSQYITVY